MPFCPHPGCPHRARTGRPAEFLPGVTRCPDCGAALVESLPPPPAPPPPPPWPRGLTRRLAWTLGVALALLLAVWLPMPLLDSEVTWGWWGGGSWRLEAVAHGPLSLGPMPFLVGLVLVELLALAVPRWRVRRREDPGFRRRLTLAGLGLGLLWAGVRGYGVAWLLEGVNGGFFAGPHAQPLVTEPGLLFRLTTSLVLAAGACVWALGAWLIDTRGVGRGFAVVLLVDILSDLPWDAWGLIHSLRTHALGPFGLAALLAAMAFGLWAFGRLWRQGTRLAGDLPARIPTCGTLPLETALVLALLPSLLVNFAGGDWLVRFSALVAPGSVTYLALALGLILLLSWPASAWFHWRHRAAWRQGEARRTWLRARLWSAAFLGGLVLADLGALRLLGLAGELYWPGALGLLVVWALAADWLEEVRALRRAGDAGLEPAGIYQDVTDALRARGQASAGCLLTGQRFRALSYFFAPYAPLVLWAPPPDPDRS